MLSISDAPARIPEDKLSPTGRYVAVQHWGPGSAVLLPAEDSDKRDVYDAAAYAADTGRWHWVAELAPGELYDRTMDITFAVAEWAAMRARHAEDKRRAATLARVEPMPGMPAREHDVCAVAVTEDSQAHPFTVAARTAWCGQCGQHAADHAGYVAPPAPPGAWTWTPPPGDAEWERQQEESRLLRVSIASGHAFTPRYRVRNAIADHVYEQLEYGIHKGDSPWLAGAYREWSAPSVRLAEAYHAGEVTREDFDAIGAAFTREWWAHHDSQWAAWSERLAREERQRQQEARRLRTSGGFRSSFRSTFRGGFR